MGSFCPVHVTSSQATATQPTRVGLQGLSTLMGLLELKTTAPKVARQALAPQPALVNKACKPRCSHEWGCSGSQPLDPGHPDLAEGSSHQLPHPVSCSLNCARREPSKGGGLLYFPLSSLQRDRFAQPTPAFGVVGSRVPIWGTWALHKPSSGRKHCASRAGGLCGLPHPTGCLLGPSSDPMGRPAHTGKVSLRTLL